MKAKRINGKFFAEGEPNKHKLTLRIPESWAEQLEQVAGGEVAAWIREAIAEKMEREGQQPTAQEFKSNLLVVN